MKNNHKPMLLLFNPTAIFYDSDNKETSTTSFVYFQTHADWNLPANPSLLKSFSLHKTYFFQYIREGIIKEINILDADSEYGCFRVCQLTFKGLWMRHRYEQKIS